MKLSTARGAVVGAIRGGFHPPLYPLGGIAFVALSVLAARSASSAPGSNPWLVTADILVGATFFLAGVAAPGTKLMRSLVAATGALWLVGTWLPGTGLLHQASLAIALTVFPSGRPPRKVYWVLVGLALPLGVGLIPQIGAAALFAGVASIHLVTPSAQGAGRYPVSSSLGVATLLASSWGYSRLDPAGFDPSFALLIYQLVLIAIAIAFPVAALSLIASRQMVTDLALRDDRPAGLDGLASVLAEAVQDPDLQVYRWQGEETGSRTGGHDSSKVATDIRRREVRLDKKPIATVAYRSPALDDPSTMEAVSKAVRLLVRQLELEEHLHVQLANLEAARARLLAAADRQQQATAMRLREDVITLLRLSRLELAAIRQGVKDSEAREALGLAFQELALAEADVEALVAGVPPARLGDGRLGGVIAHLAERSAIPVTVTTQPEAATDADTEAALFYVCSEALTNAVKHSRANRIDIALGGDLHTVALRVSDNGLGGADPSGSGLQGLADRIAIRGGKLRVESPPGAGTTVMAVLPR